MHRAPDLNGLSLTTPFGSLTLKFVIRDDDTCGLTRPEELEYSYSKLWDKSPVCLSVTPFRIPKTGERSIGELEERRETSDPVPLEENRDLVDFLKRGIQANRIHVALHGYHHNRPNGLPEYVGGDDLTRKTLHGKEYLESLLNCRISTFVPPNNKLSKDGYAAIIKAGLNVCNRQNYSRMNLRSLAPGDLLELGVTLGYSLRNRMGRNDEFEVRTYPRYKQASYFTAGPTIRLNDLQDSLRACSQSNGTFIIATHYHAFDRLMKSGETVGDAIHTLVEEARSHPHTEFVSYDALW